MKILMRSGTTIAQDNVTAADRLIDKLAEQFQLLASHPNLGERQSQLANGQFRRIVQGNYVIYYTAEEARVTIIRVLHAARDETQQL